VKLRFKCKLIKYKFIYVAVFNLSEKRIERLEQELVNANELLSAMKSKGKTSQSFLPI
jgi:hypothetical protein